MSKLRTRLCAGFLALTLGGIVVCAGDQPKHHPAAAVRDCPYRPVEVVDCPGQTETPTDCPQLDEPIRCPLADTTPAPCEPPAAIIPIALIEEPKPVVEPVPTPVVPIPSAAPVPVTPIAPVPAKPAVTAPVMPYKVRMEMVGTVTQLVLVRGEEIVLQVQCEKADVQMPAGGIQAIGKVCVAAPGIDVRCNRLWIGWHNGEISMEGNVRILCQNGQQRTEMTAESVSCRLSSVGAGLDFSPRTSSKPNE